MARADKQAAVAEMVESFNDSAGAVLTEYRGLTVKELQDLRRSLGENANYAVVKNTLAKIAANQVGITGFDDLLTGPTAIAFISGDVATVAKGLRDFAKANPHLVIKGGVMDGRVLDADAVRKLADLESREVLLAKLAGAMYGNLAKAAGLFAAPLSQVAVRNDLAAQFGWDYAGYWDAMWRVSTIYLTFVTVTLSLYYLPRLSEIRDPAELRREILGTYRIVVPAVTVI